MGERLDFDDHKAEDGGDLSAGNFFEVIRILWVRGWVTSFRVVAEEVLGVLGLFALVVSDTRTVVSVLIGLVDNLVADDLFDDVFEGDNAAGFVLGFAVSLSSGLDRHCDEGKVVVVYLKTRSQEHTSILSLVP